MQNQESSKRLYLGNLDYGLTDETLEEFIKEKGVSVKEATIIKDRETGRSKGFGFCELADDSNIEDAIEKLNEQELNGRNLRVSQAREREPRKPYGGHSRY